MFLIYYRELCAHLLATYYLHLSLTGHAGDEREYNPNDRVNPKAQLDPQSGKSLEFMESRKKQV
jgi:hypothetical protein